VSVPITAPLAKPRRPQFGSGPCAKRPGWTPDALAGALTGRSHRSAAGRQRLAEVLSRSRELSGLPGDMRLAIVPGSDTGAMEAALWSLLGARPVDVLACDTFGRTWADDITRELGLEARVLEAPFGQLPDLAAVDFARDVVFTWNATSSGVCMPASFAIPAARDGLTVCDATSAVFAMQLPWAGLDVVTWSWQKALGGEGAHGMLALSPRAFERLRSYRPARPVPKILRIAERGLRPDGLFEGSLINTPSMLCVEDALDGLRWAESIGGLPELFARTARNYACIETWVAQHPHIRFFVQDPVIRSRTSVCLEFCGSEYLAQPEARRRQIVEGVVSELDAAGVAFDIRHYRQAPAGLRIWCGPTVDTGDLAALLPWIDWAYARQLAALGAKA
jgi:phosphoserine aminotransferase